MNYQNLILLTSLNTKRTLMHLFLFTNSAKRELGSICTRVYATAINFPCITTLLQAKIYVLFLTVFSNCGFSRNVTLRLNPIKGRGGNCLKLVIFHLFQIFNYFNFYRWKNNIVLLIVA